MSCSLLPPFPFRFPRTGPSRSGLRRSGSAMLTLLLAATLAACGDGPVSVLAPDSDPIASTSPGRSGPGGTGVLQVRVVTVGDAGAQPYTLHVGAEARVVAASDTVTWPRMAAGPVDLRLEGVPSECRVGGEHPRVVEVAAQGLTRTEFQVTCDRAAALSASPQGPTVRATVGAAGGVVEATGDDGTRMTLTIPAGALSAPVQISMTPARFSGLPEVVETFLGGAILEPSGLTFAIPATLTLAPADGVEGRLWPMGFVADNAGGVEWILPRGGEAPETMDIEVPHFSLAGASVLTSAYWYLLYEMYGARPVISGEFVEVRLESGRSNYRTPVCFRVTGIDAAPLMGIPVEMSFLRTPRGELASDAAVTGRDGLACVDHAVGIEELFGGLSPLYGEWILIRGVSIPGHRFQGEAVAGIIFHDPRPATVEVAFPSAVRSHETFELCATVNVEGLREGENMNLRTTVYFPLRPGDPSWFTELTSYLSPDFYYARDIRRGDLRQDYVDTGADGRGCVGVRFSVPFTEGDGIFRVPFQARISREDPTTLLETRWIEVDTVIVVEAGPFNLSLSGPSQVRPGGEAEICADLRRGDVGVNGVFIAFASWDEGGFRGPPPAYDTVQERRRESGRGEVPGRGCVTYLAPEVPEGDSTRLTAEVSIADRRTRSAEPLELQAEWILQFDGPDLLLTADPTVLARGGATSRVCALYTREQGATPIPEATVFFSLAGAGSLESTSAVTDEAGEACLTYTAPDPLPGGLVDVVIEAEVASVEGTARNTVTVRLGMPFTLTLAATPAHLTAAGSTSTVCGTLWNTGTDTPVTGTPVIFGVSGPGTLSSITVNTGEDGRACTGYTAPSPLPSGTTDVVISGEAYTELETIRGSTGIRLSSSFPLAILTTTLPQGLVGADYVADIMAGGGSGFRTWSLSAGSLPPGLAFSQVSAQGRIAGIPSTAGSFAFTLRVATSTESTEQSYTLVVNAPSEGGGGVGGGGGGPRCAIVVGEYPGGGTYLNPPFTLRATVGDGCGTGLDIRWDGGTQNNTLVTITEIPGFRIMGASPLQPDLDNPGGYLGYVTVDYDRALFLSPLFPQREGFVRGCVLRNGEPILNEFGDEVCAMYRWFN